MFHPQEIRLIIMAVAITERTVPATKIQIEIPTEITETPLAATIQARVVGVPVQVAIPVPGATPDRAVPDQATAAPIPAESPVRENSLPVPAMISSAIPLRTDDSMNASGGHHQQNSCMKFRTAAFCAGLCCLSPLSCLKKRPALKEAASDIKRILTQSAIHLRRMPGFSA